MSGLGVSIQPKGTRTFFLARMARGKRRYARIGDADAMTVPEAQREGPRTVTANGVCVVAGVPRATRASSEP